MVKKILPAVVIIVLAVAVIAGVLLFGGGEGGENDAAKTTGEAPQPEETQPQTVGDDIPRNEDGLIIVSVDTFPELFSANTDNLAGGQGVYGLDETYSVTYDSRVGVSVDYESGVIQQPYELIIPDEWEGYPVVNVHLRDDDFVESVILPEFCDHAYIYECPQLRRVSINAAIGQLELPNCHNIEEVEIPENCTLWIFDGCLNNVDKIERFAFPSGVKYITCSFMGMENLTELTLNDGLEFIDTSIRDCPNLTTLDVPDSVTTIKNSFTGCDNLTLIVGRGTAAEQYAIENGIPYEYREEDVYCKG